MPRFTGCRRAGSFNSFVPPWRAPLDPKPALGSADGDGDFASSGPYPDLEPCEIGDRLFSWRPTCWQTRADRVSQGLAPEPAPQGVALTEAGVGAV
jgi:hypothetical protein